MGTQGTGRKRSTKKERSTAEDDALNLIAREAEARLAAKRAARAEAREIRMRELERQQKEIFQVQKKYYGLDTKSDERGDSKWGDIEQWMEDSEKYSRSSRIQTLSDDDERMSVGSRGSVRSDLDVVAAYGGDSSSHRKSKKKKKHKHKDKERNGYEDDYSVMSSRSSRLSDESRMSRSSRLDLTSSRLSDDSRVSRGSRLDLQPASYASSDLYSFNGLSSSRNAGSAFNGYQSSLYEDSLCSGSRRVVGSSSHPLDFTNYRSSSSRASSRASSARTSPVDNCSSVASFLRSAAGSSVLPRDLDHVTIPDFSDVDDRDYLEKGSRAASALTAGTLTSLGGTSSRRGSGETSLTVDAETSIREIKEIHELKDQIQDVEARYAQNLKEAKDTLAEVEEKYRKAMVSNAQLDNEKNNLMYQVDTLKDSLMELEELLSESRRGYEDKVKELEREKHGHSVLQFQFNELKETLKQSEELLNEIRQLRMKQEGFVREVSDLQETVEWKDKKIAALERQKEYTDAIRVERDELREEVVKLKDILKKHGIVLGPDLNVNGDVGGTDGDASSGADSASQSAPDSQTPPTEGNSVLGNTEETQLGSKGEEDLDPEQPQDVFEEAKDNELRSDGVSRLETPDDHDPAEEQQQLSPSSNKDHVDKSVPSKDLNVDIVDSKVVEADSVVTCSQRPEEDATSLEEKIPKTTGTESKNNNGDIGESVNNNVSKDQDQRPDVVEERSPQKDESVPVVSKAESQQESGNVEEAENDDGEQVSGKCQPQGGAAGKKKRRKKKGKKKGGTQDEKNQDRDETDSKGKESTSRDDGRPLEAGVDGSVQEPKVEHGRESLDVAEAEAAKPSGASPHSEAVKESRMDQVPEDQDKELVHVDHHPLASTETRQEAEPDLVMFEENEGKSLETAETEAVTETCSQVEALEESTTGPKKDQEDKGPSLETAETITEVQTLEESTTDPKKDQEDKGPSLETVETITEVQTLEQSTTDLKKDQEDKGPSLETAETITEVQTLEESTVESKNDQQSDQQSLEMLETEVVAETCSHAETLEFTTDPQNDPDVDQSLETVETITETSDVPTLESTTDLKEDQRDQEPSLETVETITVQTLAESRTEPEHDQQDVEERLEPEKAVGSGSSPPDFSLTSLDLIDVSEGAVNAGGVDTVSTSRVDDAGDKTNHENTLETSGEEDQGQRSEDPTPEASGSTDCSETQENLTASKDSIQDSAELNLEAAENQELDLDSREPAGLIEPCGSPMKPVDELDPEQSPETDQQAKEDQAHESPAEVSPETEEMDLLDSARSPEEAAAVESSAERDPGAGELAAESSPEQDPGAGEPAAESSPEQDPGAGEPAAESSLEQDPGAGEPVAESSAERDPGAGEPVVESSAERDPGAEELTAESSAEQDPGAEESAVAAEPELKNTQTQQHDPKDDKSHDSSQPCLEDGENDEDEEGQSFDFDDMDVEEAVTHQTNSVLQEEVEEGVEVTESRGNTRDNDEDSEDKRPVDGEVVDEESQDVHHEKTTGEGEEVVVVVAEEPAAAELDGVGTDPINQEVAPPSPVEEGLDAVKHELLQDEDVSAAPKSSDQASRNKEASPPSRKDVKKNSKKGKAKGKEECKMS